MTLGEYRRGYVVLKQTKYRNCHLDQLWKAIGLSNSLTFCFNEKPFKHIIREVKVLSNITSWLLYKKNSL